ncbi:nucleolar transcription factor 1-like isoform X2 [Sphaeramia orbicularis]|uniref:nucleolar transcription factor 1-like isoform X2 n=1 Tax=Sphaeramia orbicularis TaxID=375764 RepID=UPI00117FFDFE|nr:nucleolar transcription factor 1-like isoform X2 [Sphaeramia orbicularis]
METEKPAVWSEDQLLTLLGAMKKNIPKHTRKRTWTYGKKALDWNQIAFEPFSPEECRGKWEEILQRLCKIRTLPELILEAEIANSRYSENNQINPEYPKRPAPAHICFYKENLAKLKKTYPNARHSKLLQRSARKYQMLPEEEKQQHEENAKRAKEDYRRRVIEFKKCSKSKQLKKDSQVKEESSDGQLQNDQEEANAEDGTLHPNIPRSAYGLFRKEQLDSMGDVPFSNYSKVWSQRWRNLTDSQKMEYHKRCQEMKKEHGIKSNALMLQNDQEETNTEDSILTCKPPVSGYRLFCREHPDLIVDVLEPKWPAVWRQHWRNLTETQRNEYIKRCKEMKREHTVKLNEFLEDMDVEEQEQILKKYNLKRPKLPKGKMAEFPNEPKKPPRGANIMFCIEQMKHLKEIKKPKQRFSAVNQMWRHLSRNEKVFYKKKLEERVLQYSVELQRWFKTLTPRKQEQYRRANPSRCRYLNSKYASVDDDEEASKCQPSDSEDEDFEDSSSENDVVIVEDEEEDDDVENH